MKIFFITSNPGKVREFRQILEPEVEVEHLFMSYPELRSDDPLEISGLSAKQLADKLNKAVVVEDSGLFIQALNDFPGTCSSYIHKRIGLKGILKLMKGVKDRKCFYKSAVAYCEPGKNPVCFLGQEEGTIAASIKGKGGFGHDPIFTPKGSKKTYGQMPNVEEMKKFRRMAVLKLLKYLKSC